MTAVRRSRQRHAAGVRIAGHRHDRAYATLVVSGGYEEAGPEGLRACDAGVLVVHPPFHVHADRFGAAGAALVDFELAFPAAAALGLDAYRVVRLARPERLETARDAAGGLAEALDEAVGEVDAPPGCWRDRMAETLRTDPAASIGGTAAILGVSAEHATRAFRKRFAMSPGAFRAEQRLRAAVRALAAGAELADAAADAGYADQAHMSRALKAATGRTPAELRAALEPDQIRSRRRTA